MKKHIIIILLIVFAAQANAQIVVNGKVKNARTGELLGSANVTLHKKGSDNIIGYSICNNNGEFSARAAAQSDSIDVRVAYLGFAEQKITVAPHSQTLNFSLDEKEFVLPEVKVRAPKIRGTGDTISYNASQFTREQDRMLVDMLDRLPGVEVDKQSGGIKYQGTAINRFYVENQNLMDGRYGEISKNLPADAVKAIEVFENHQPVRALQDINFSNQAAMNIKLTDKAKGKWIGNGITAGLGLSPLLWKAELSAMRFSPKYQTYITYKTNNTGQDIKIYNNFVTITFVGMDEANTNAFYSPFISSPELQSKRSLFNRSHVLSINNLWKTGSDANIRFNIDYKNEEKQQESSQTTKYYLPADSVFVYSEQYRVRSYENKLGANITYTKNERKFFLENKFSANADWQTINTTIKNDGEVNQHLLLPGFDVSNNFKIIKRTESKRTYNFTSNSKFSIKPQKLVADINALSGNLVDFTQRADVKTFESENSISFGHVVKKVNINYNAGYDLNINNYNTDIQTFSRSKHNIYFTPSMSRDSKWLRTTLSLPLSYTNISGKNISSFSGVIFEPSLRITYKMNYFTDVYLSGALSSDLGSVYDVVSDVMKDYRSRYIFDGALPRRNSASAGLGLSYKNPIKAFFTYFNLSYNRSTSKNTGEQIIDGEYVINKIVEGKNSAQSLNASGSFSKIFDWQRCSAKFNWTVSNSKSTQLQNSVNIPFSTFGFSASPGFDIETFANQVLSYSFSIAAHRSTISSSKQPFMHSIKQNFTYYIPITKKLNLMFVGEYLRNQKSTTQYVNMFLMDAIVRYQVSPKFEFTLNWNNIFDTREYSYSFYNDLYYTSYSYKLRPTNIIVTANIKFK